MDNFLSRAVYEDADSNLPGQFVRVYKGTISRNVVHNRTSDWDSSLRDELNVLCNLRDGWDGYDSPAVRFENAECAINLLSLFKQYADNSALNLQDVTPNLPYLVPVAGGALQAEWHIDNHFVELFFDGIEPVNVSFYTKGVDETEEFPLDCSSRQIDLSPLFRIFKQIHDMRHADTEAA